MTMQLLRKLICFFEAGQVGQTPGMMSPWSEAAMSSRLVLRSFSEAWCMISERTHRTVETRKKKKLIKEMEERKNKKGCVDRKRIQNKKKIKIKKLRKRAFEEKKKEEKKREKNE